MLPSNQVWPEDTEFTAKLKGTKMRVSWSRLYKPTQSFFDSFYRQTSKQVHFNL
jgi:hypothetical protein